MKLESIIMPYDMMNKMILTVPLRKYMDKVTQNETLRNKSEECERRNASEAPPQQDGPYCQLAWDGIYCWPPHPAGSLATIQCPSYIVGFNTHATASRYCEDTGDWFYHPDRNTSWTNYTLCVETGRPLHHDIHKIAQWLPLIKRISQLGYSVSLGTLLVAFFILAAFKKLRCPRNMLHMHLFGSFMLRAVMALTKDFLFYEGLALYSDLTYLEDELAVLEVNPNWQCKLITSLWQYSIMANYAWILMEGLYLHNLIFRAPFSDNSAINLYVALGWGLPYIFVLLWIIARILWEDHLCWTTGGNRYNLSIIQIPTALSVGINFLLFLNIVRVLLLKLRSSVALETRKYRKWAKSTLVLVPLFGVHYTIFLCMSYAIGLNYTVEIVWLFCDQFFASFQGFFVALLYCLLNGEVRLELGRKWHRCRVRRPSTPWTAHSLFTSSKLFSRTRGSCPSTNIAKDDEISAGPGGGGDTDAGTFQDENRTEAEIPDFNFAPISTDQIVKELLLEHLNNRSNMTHRRSDVISNDPNISDLSLASHPSTRRGSGTASSTVNDDSDDAATDQSPDLPRDSPSPRRTRKHLTPRGGLLVPLLSRNSVITVTEVDAPNMKTRTIKESSL